VCVAACVAACVARELAFAEAHDKHHDCNTHCNTHCHTHCNTLQHTATHTAAHTATHSNTLQHNHFKKISPLCTLSRVTRPMPNAHWDPSADPSGMDPYPLIMCAHWYGVSAISKFLKIVGLFCRMQSLLQGSFAKETYYFKEPTNWSHPICSQSHGCTWAKEREMDFGGNLSTDWWPRRTLNNVCTLIRPQSHESTLAKGMGFGGNLSTDPWLIGTLIMCAR